MDATVNNICTGNYDTKKHQKYVPRPERSERTMIEISWKGTISYNVMQRIEMEDMAGHITTTNYGYTFGDDFSKISYCVLLWGLLLFDNELV